MRLKLFWAAALGVAFAAPALAADLPSQKAPPVFVPPPPPPPLWTGFYVGLNLGGGWSANNGGGDNLGTFFDPALPLGGANLFILPNQNRIGNEGGVVGGGQIGYNYQFGQNFVIGAEADFQGTSFSNRNSNNNVFFFPSPLVPGSFLVPLGANGGGNLSLPWFGTVRGRLGFLFTPTVLVYGTGGFAYGEVQAFNTFNDTRTGWTAGGGAEWMFMPNWSAKVEYLYVNLNQNNGNNGAFGFQFGTRIRPQINVVRAGINYHFNFGSSAPIVGKF